MSAATAETMPTPNERAVMTMLMQRGHYRETPDDYEWLRHDAARAVAAAPDGYLGVSAALLDTGLHGEQGVEDQRDADCFDQDIRLVLTICGLESRPISGENGETP